MYGGVVADGKVDDREILFLDVWLKENREYLDAFPLNMVSDRLRDILSDGVITQAEKDDLYSMLGQLVGGTLEESWVAGGNSTLLPFDQVGCIEFEDKVFCFTGKFIRGQRSVCEDLVMSLGASVVKNVVKRLDYLVIGELASRDWVAASHGRKIEKALFYREQGGCVLILSEQGWVRFL